MSHGNQGDFNRHELNNAGFKINGYFFDGPSSRLAPEALFLQAQATCLEHMKHHLACIRQLTFAQFIELRRKGFNG
jgi:hypothetical protein